MYNINYNNVNIYDQQNINKLSSSVSSLNSDEDLDNANLLIIRDRRRELHTQAEQRRRDAIKNGYDSLIPLVHPSSEAQGSKLSKGTILQRTISQIGSLTEQTRIKGKELENLKNELVALRIMNSNYEEMAKCNQSDMRVEKLNEVPENVKFEIFSQFMLQLFKSFDKMTKFDNFSVASTTIIHWVEEYCKPQNLNVLVESVLTDVLTNYQRNENIDLPMGSAPNNITRMDNDYIDPSPLSFNLMEDHSFDFPSTTNREIKSNDNTVNGNSVKRELVTLLSNDSGPQNRLSVPPTLSTFDSSIEDEILSLSPNAMEFLFLDSLDQNNLIDDSWLSSE